MYEGGIISNHKLERCDEFYLNFAHTAHHIRRVLLARRKLPFTSYLLNNFKYASEKQKGDLDEVETR